MKKACFYLIPTLALYFTSLIASAHDAKLHRGKPIEGKVEQIAASSISVRTTDRQLSITLDKTTVYEIGKEGKKTSLNDLHTGANVKVFGTKLESGEIVAREILIDSNSEPKQKGE